MSCHESSKNQRNPHDHAGIYRSQSNTTSTVQQGHDPWRPSGDPALNSVGWLSIPVEFKADILAAESHQGIIHGGIRGSGYVDSSWRTALCMVNEESLGANVYRFICAEAGEVLTTRFR